MNEIIEQLGIQFSCETSRQNLFLFHRNLNDGIAERPILVLAGPPSSRKDELASLVMALGEMDFVAEILGTSDASRVQTLIDADLIKESDMIVETARIVAAAAAQPYVAERPSYVLIKKTAWYSLSPEEEARALRVDLLPALETAGIGEVS